MDAVDRRAGFINAHIPFRYQHDNLIFKCCITLHRQQCLLHKHKSSRKD